jgi:shikimate kinase / 3-dehydroquinate synthase
MMKIILYGPPGSGKSATGRLLAGQLGLPFFDLDREIEQHSGMGIPGLFASQGEAGFRALELAGLSGLLEQPGGFVLALGGGALLNPEARRRAEAAGQVICLNAGREVLLQRLQEAGDGRPLLAGDLSTSLEELLLARAAHYASFPKQVDTGPLTPEQAAWAVQVRLGCFSIAGMGASYPYRVLEQGLEGAGALLAESGLGGSLALVCDETVAALHGERLLASLRGAGFACQSVVLPPGEEAKNLQSAAHLWDRFLQAGLDRKSSLLALGGGVITDLTGFSAACYLRGIRWIALPSTLLSMVDASLGGKTGVDLPQGKNLVGAFHPPAQVLAYAGLLATLPGAEVRNGLAEVVKHGVIASPSLYDVCAGGWSAFQAYGEADWAGLVAQAAAVKVRVILEDPYEQGLRAVLNFGHTVGHAIEQASGYRLRHGEAVSAGMVVEARIGESLGVTEPGTAAALSQVLEGLGLPTRVPEGLDHGTVRSLLRVDKKNQAGKARLALPVRIGCVRPGYELEEEELWKLYLSCTAQT